MKTFTKLKTGQIFVISGSVGDSYHLRALNSPSGQGDQVTVHESQIACIDTNFSIVSGFKVRPMVVVA